MLVNPKELYALKILLWSCALVVRHALDRVGDFISDIGLEYNELITILPISSQEIKDSIWPLYKSFQKEGVRL